MDINRLVVRLGLRNTLANREFARRIIRRPFLEEIQQRQRDREVRNRLLERAVAVPTDHRTFNETFHPLFKELDTDRIYQYVFLRNKKIVKIKYFKTPLKFSSFKYNYFFINGSDQDPEFYGADQILVNASNITKEKLNQIFRDGDKFHCVFDPIIEYWNQKSNVSNRSRYRQKKFIQRATELKEIYSNGVPETEMEYVAKECGIQLRYNDFLSPINRPIITAFNKENRNHILKFINSRENHLEVLTNPIEVEVEQEELEILSDRPDAITRMTRDNCITNVYTPTANYHTKISPSQQLINEQLSQLRIHGLSRRSPYADFVSKVNLIHSAPVNLSNDIPEHHKDIEKAYYNHKYSPNYRGVLGTIHQFRKLSNEHKSLIKTNLGFYTIRITQITHDLITKLVGLKLNQTYTIFSPEIITYEPYIKYDLLAGFWGSAIHIKWLKGMNEKVIVDGKKQSIYAIFAGQLATREKKYKFKASQSFANHLATTNNVSYFDGTAVVSLPTKSPVQDHIFASITSYTRIMLFTELLKLNTEQIIRVVLDGVYFKGNDTTTSPLLKIKEIKTFETDSEPWYSHANNEVPDFPEWKTPVPLTRNAFLTGQGGSGKTFSIFSDEGYNNPMYITPTIELGMNSKQHWITINRAIGIGCASYLEQGNFPPAVLFVDEMTLHSQYNIHKLQELYPHSLIIYAGDINPTTKRAYQLNLDFIAKPYTPTTEQIIHFPNDYRSLDENIKQLKLSIRDMIDKNIGIKQQMEIIQKIIPPISLQSALELYDPTTDHFITGKHRPDIPNYKTIHSIQGQTYTTKTFILFDLFGLEMLYTAISRVRNFNQISLVLPSPSPTPPPTPPPSPCQKKLQYEPVSSSAL